MNRSIMIVICDFLVLCALSLSSGLSELPDAVIPENPGYRDGYAVVPGSQAVAAKDYEELKASAEKLKKELADLKAGSAMERASFSESEKERNARLADAEKRVGTIASKLFRTEKELKEAAAALVQARKESAEHKRELKVSGQRVEDLKTALSATRTMAGNQEKEILWQRGEMEKARKKQDATEKKLDESRTLAKEKEIALAKADKDIASLNRELKRTSDELRKSREIAIRRGKNIADMQGRLIRKTEESAGLQKLLDSTKKQLVTAEEKLVTAEKKLESSSLEKYSSSAVKLSFSVSNVRPLLGDNVYSMVSYLPEIRLGNRIFLPAAFLPVTGLDRNFSGYTQVNKLRYAVSLPSGTGKEVTLTQDFLVPGNAPGLCLIPVKGMSGAPLPVLTWDKLKKRGLRYLTLFKAGKFGSASAELAERCSLDITGKDRSLFIRNSHRKASELTAEPGDIVITKEGEYVGTVVGLSEDGNGHSTARCFVFASAEIPAGSTIPVVRGKKEQFYTGFSNQTEALRRRLKKLDPVYNR